MTACTGPRRRSCAKRFNGQPSDVRDCRLLIANCRWVLAAGLFVAACGSGYTAVEKPSKVSWKHVGSWSGRGNRQTESFTSDTGGFRVHWEAKNEAPPGSGRLKVTFRSGDSGREIMEAVDTHGEGHGTAEVGDRPRWYFLTIESANVDWTITVEEQR